MRLDSTAARRRQVGAPASLKHWANFVLARKLSAETPVDSKKAA
jgi:hypothetical protein